MDAPELSVYGEAKSEYTRQLCVFLVPSLETYFLDLLQTAKEQAATPQKALWQFQTLLQAIPEWNQDKVLRETEKVQKDTKCDYLEELLTAVFIAHTKVLSAIRLTTKQKKLQITIPKLDHFLHRLLSECARTLWTNAFLFADGNSIEKQKNLRQVSSLLQESVLQAIRGMLPVKNILREYLNQDEDDEEPQQEVPEKTQGEVVQEAIEETQKETVKEVPQEAVEEAPKEEVEEAPKEEVEEAPKEEVEEAPKEEVEESAKDVKESVEEVPKETVEEVPQQTPTVPAEAEKDEQPIINIDTKPSVSFTQDHVFFDSHNLEANEIHEIPFAEAENRPPEEDEEDEDEELDTIKITDEELPMDAEILE